MPSLGVPNLGRFCMPIAPHSLPSASPCTWDPQHERSPAEEPNSHAASRNIRGPSHGPRMGLLFSTRHPWIPVPRGAHLRPFSFARLLLVLSPLRSNQTTQKCWQQLRAAVPFCAGAVAPFSHSLAPSIGALPLNLGILPPFHLLGDRFHFLHLECRVESALFPLKNADLEFLSRRANPAGFHPSSRIDSAVLFVDPQPLGLDAWPGSFSLWRYIHLCSGWLRFPWKTPLLRMAPNSCLQTSRQAPKPIGAWARAPYGFVRPSWTPSTPGDRAACAIPPPHERWA